MGSLLWTAGVLAGEATLRRPVYEIEDGAQARRFVVSTSDTATRAESGEWRIERRTKAAADPESLRREQVERRRKSGRDAELVLYPEGERPHSANQRIVSGKIAFTVASGIDAREVAQSHGLKAIGFHSAARGFYLAKGEEPGSALEAAEALRSDPRVTWVQPQLGRRMKPRFTPNDTYFTQQWHLANTGQSGGTAGVDARVTTLWDTYRGAGIRIGIVDDGLPTDHPDLTANVDTVNDHDWNDGTPNDPAPNAANEDFHGTAVAGIAAARGNNSVGVSGVAPEATLVGLRLTAANFTDSDEAEAIGWRNELIQIKNNSWGPDDLGNTLVGPGTLMEAAMQTAVTNGRGGKGTIIVWAGGNGAEIGDNSNYDGYANSIYAIGVGAIGNTGVRSAFSELGANLAVVAPSAGGTLKLVTTDLVGSVGYNTPSSSGDLAQRSYTNSFGGTSGATPVVSGISAMMLQANPNLGWRDVKEILIRTARKCDPSDAGWVRNGGGISFNHKYGAGLVDAQAAVARALTWTNLPPMEVRTFAQTGLNVTVPNNTAAGVIRSFPVTEPGFRVEQVTVKVNITHTGRGDLEIILVSPSGTESRLAEPHNDTNDDFAGWTFSSMQQWGEPASGTWQVKINDRKTGNAGGIVKAVTLKLHGAPGNLRPQITAASLGPSPSAFVGDQLSVANITAADPDGDAIGFGYQWQQTSDGASFVDIPGATSSALSSTAALSGLAVRCQVTPQDANGAGLTFATGLTDLRRRPPQFAQTGTNFSFDFDLYIPGGLGNYKFAMTSENIPGLSINPQTGVLEGVVNQNSGGYYAVIIERAQGSSVGVTQSFSFVVLDGSGQGIVPMGKTLRLQGNQTINGNVSVLGGLDTDGQTLTVTGTLGVSGSIINTTGAIEYSHRSGLLPGGVIRLTPNAANDLADTDRDGVCNLLEFLLGTDPSTFSNRPGVARVGGNNVLTFSTPVGAQGVTYAVEVSPDLVTWTSGAAATETVSNMVSGDLRTLSVRDKSMGSTRYIRLKVSR